MVFLQVALHSRSGLSPIASPRRSNSQNSTMHHREVRSSKSPLLHQEILVSGGGFTLPEIVGELRKLAQPPATLPSRLRLRRASVRLPQLGDFVGAEGSSIPLFSRQSVARPVDEMHVAAEPIELPDGDGTMSTVISRPRSATPTISTRGSSRGYAGKSGRPVRPNCRASFRGDGLRRPRIALETGAEFLNPRRASAFLAGEPAAIRYLSPRATSDTASFRAGADSVPGC